MLCIVGTVPANDFPLMEGPVTLQGEHLQIGEFAVHVNRGTPLSRRWRFWDGRRGLGKGRHRVRTQGTDLL